jgi:hypothetical protein
MYIDTHVVLQFVFGKLSSVESALCGLQVSFIWFA